MKIYHNLKDVPSDEAVSLAIGNFDGVHYGHLEIIEKCKRSGSLCTVLTFDVHPREYLYPGFSPRLLTLKHEKYAFLRSAGVDIIIELPFAQYCSVEPINFLEILNRELHLDSITVGFNFFFGQNQKGNADLIYWWGRSAGVRINVVPPFIKNGLRISSTVIRELVSSGEVSNARDLMKYPFVISGTVVQGRKIGREMNYPTLNLEVPQKTMPPDGVYITETVFNGSQMMSLTNIGSSPTIDTELRTRRVETWIEGKNIGLLYGQEIAVYFLEKIREEIKFSSREKLLEMISVDRSRLASFSNSSKSRDLPDLF
jgi:riboflavin kinase/FMN adenylyltransferase